MFNNNSKGVSCCASAPSARNIHCFPPRHARALACEFLEARNHRLMLLLRETSTASRRELCRLESKSPGGEECDLLCTLGLLLNHETVPIGLGGRHTLLPAPRSMRQRPEKKQKKCDIASGFGAQGGLTKASAGSPASRRVLCCLFLHRTHTRRLCPQSCDPPPRGGRDKSCRWNQGQRSQRAVE